MRIAFVARHQEIRKIAQEVAKEMDLELTTILATPENCVEIVQDLIKKDYDVVVLRGGLHDIVQADSSIPSTRLVRCDALIGENLSCLFNARQLAASAHPTICSVGRPPYPETKEMERILQVNLITIPPLSLSEIQAELERLMKYVPIDVLTTRVEYVESLRWTGLPIYAHQSKFTSETIRVSLQMAYGVAKAMELQRKNVDELSEILHHSFDAILYVDQQGIIRLCNVAAEAILHLRGTNIQGVPLWEFIPALSETEVQAVLDGEEMIGHLVDISGRTYVLNGAKLEFASQIHGASFYFKELSKIETMERHIRNEMVSKGQTAQFSFQDIIGDSPAILTAKQTAERFARHDSTVLLLGETGTGKELFAQSIHNASRRRHHPFVAVNCAALSPTLLESELFGYVEGAFTGAMRKGKRGLFEVADGGTIFLDEISEMDYGGQTKLLRVLAENCITRVGDDAARAIDVRVICATNQKLEDAVEQGKFRKDLYYRLNVLSLHVPPLRSRGKDIPYLFDYYLNIFGQKEHRRMKLAPDAVPIIQEYGWPGNVRQLRNFCERLVVVSETSVLDSALIATQLALAFPNTNSLPHHPLGADGQGEREEILRALHQCHGARNKTAQLLGISTATLWRKMKKYDLQ